MRKNDFLQVDEAKFARSRNVWIEVGKNWKERRGDRLDYFRRKENKGRPGVCKWKDKLSLNSTLFPSKVNGKRKGNHCNN